MKQIVLKNVVQNYLMNVNLLYLFMKFTKESLQITQMMLLFILVEDFKNTVLFGLKRGEQISIIQIFTAEIV